MILFLQPLKVYYFLNSSNHNLVKEFIEGLREKPREKILSIIDAFETYGFHLETKYLRRISGTKALWE